ncbi:hypothetical protein [uncultured Caballeronia sp.]|uniref:hypothetical protein n=1 Tax=uncultured Caballeronia sp. TaxID=1827198 RepID=UPI0035CC6B1D
MANLNDFRGLGEPDSCTAFEVGFATASASLYGHIGLTLDRLSNRSLKRPTRLPPSLCARENSSVKTLA